MRKTVNDAMAHDVGFRFAAISKNGKCVGYYPTRDKASKFAPRGSQIVPIVNTKDSVSRALTAASNRVRLAPSNSRKNSRGSHRGIAMLKNPISTFDAARASAGMSKDELEKNRIILAPDGYTIPQGTLDRVKESYGPGIRTSNSKGAPFIDETVWPVPNINIPAPKGLSYLPHQVAAIIAMARRKNVLLADQQGLGKTMEIVGYMNLLTPDKTMIVSPRTMKGTWIRELKKWSTRNLKIVEVQGTPTKIEFKIPRIERVGSKNRTKVVYDSIPSLPKDTNVIIATYKIFVSRQPEIVYTADGDPISLKSSVKTATKNLISELFKQNVDLLVLDEVHDLSNRKAVMTKAFFGEKPNSDIPGSGFIGMVNLATNKIFATGTPLRGGDPSTLFHFLTSLSKRDFPSGFTFNESFGGEPISGGSPGRKKKGEESKEKNPDMLGIKMRDSVMIRRLAKDVLDLPKEIRKSIEALDTPEIEKAFELQKAALDAAGITENDIKIEDVSEDEAAAALADIAEALMDDALSPEEKAKLEEAAESDFAASQSKLAATYGTKKKYLFQQITPARVAMSIARAKQFMYTLGEIERITKGKTNGKIVVFFHHKAALNEALKALAKAGYTKDDWVIVDGNTKSEESDDAVESFQNEDVKFFFGSIKTCAAGLTLTKANVCLFLETDWTPAYNLQAEKRIHRIGQEAEVCFFFYSVKQRSIDANVVRVTIDKIDTQREILDKFPSERQVDKFENRFKEKEIVGAKYQIPDRYAIRAALLDACKQLGTEPSNEKRYNWDTGKTDTVKDYVWAMNSERCQRAQITSDDYNKMARAARELQYSDIIRTASLNENLIDEALPVLWKVRTFVEKKSLLNNINWPTEITGRSAGLFSPERILDTSKDYFGLLASTLFNQRVNLHKKFLEERAEGRRQKKDKELEDMIDSLGELEIEGEEE